MKSKSLVDMAIWIMIAKEKPDAHTHYDCQKSACKSSAWKCEYELLMVNPRHNKIETFAGNGNAYCQCQSNSKWKCNSWLWTPISNPNVNMNHKCKSNLKKWKSWMQMWIWINMFHD